MPVDLKSIPDVSIRMAPPKLARWIVVLIIMIGLSMVISRVLTGKNNAWISVGIPALIVGGLLFILLVIYLVQQIFANARDREREKVIIQEVRRGRRALQILAAECCTAHSQTDNPFTPVASNLLQNENVFFPQRSWRGEENIRHSQLTRAMGIKAEQHLRMLFRKLIQKLAVPLSKLPADKPIMLLLESSSSIPDEKTHALWWQAWEQSNIKQNCSCLNGSGAQVIDTWLDHNIRSDALLLVIAWQYAPENTSLSAEAITAVLLGNRLTQDTLSPVAFLHRPESGGNTLEEMQYSIAQSLDWVPVAADIPEHLWLSGVVAETDEYIALMKVIDDSALKNIDQQNGMHNFNDFLGDPGEAALWLAVVAATQSMQQQPVHHLLIIREAQNGKVWNMVVFPVATAKEGEA